MKIIFQYCVLLGLTTISLANHLKTSSEILERSGLSRRKNKQCVTDGVEGYPCVFPFIYKSVKYYSCTEYKSSTWCSTKTGAGDHYLKGWWDYCDQESCFNCGRSNDQFNPCFANIGDYTPMTSQTRMPWYAFIKFNNHQRGIHEDCGAAILSKRWLISTKFCYTQKGYIAQKSDLSVSTGTNYVDYLGYYGKTHGVIDTIELGDALVMFKIGPPITFFSDTSMPVCLPRSASYDITDLNAVYGYWEYTILNTFVPDDTSQVLYKSGVKILNSTLCDTKDNTRLCAQMGTHMRDLLPGGPLVAKINGSCTLIGLLADSKSCQRGRYCDYDLSCINSKNCFYDLKPHVKQIKKVLRENN